MYTTGPINFLRNRYTYTAATPQNPAVMCFTVETREGSPRTAKYSIKGVHTKHGGLLYNVRTGKSCHSMTSTP